VLYIKNLAKEVQSNDLARLFARYYVKDEQDVQYNLLQKGKMRGQAFVTLHG
jgi:RNA recognition motif.